MIGSCQRAVSSPEAAALLAAPANVPLPSVDAGLQGFHQEGRMSGMTP